jgi:N-acetylglucosamine kinase-like BadF-type ATPase
MPLSQLEPKAFFCYVQVPSGHAAAIKNHSGDIAMSYCIGISSGHRKTFAVAICSDEVAEFARVDESLNFHNANSQTIVRTLRRIVEELVARLGGSQRELLNDPKNRIVLSLPGVSTEENRELGLYFLRTIGCQDNRVMRVVDETWSGLVAGLLQERGICAFAGSGASVFFGHEGFQLGKPHKLDGYGVILGDYGGGFRVAVHLLEEIGKTIDAEVKPLPLFAEVYEQLKPDLEKPEGLQAWFDSLFTGAKRDAWRQEVAKLAQVVTEAADRETPDPTAKRIIEQAADEMAKTIKTGLRRFGDACQGLPITCQGGMFRFSKLYFERVQYLVANEEPRFPDNEVRKALYHPVVGAALMARAAADEAANPFYPDPIQTGLPAREATVRILESVFRQPGDVLENLVISATASDPFGAA